MCVALCLFEELINAGLMLDQRHRQCTNINPALGQRVVIIGIT